VFVVGLLLLCGMALSGFWHEQRNKPATVSFERDLSHGNFARIDAEEMRQYRAPVSRRAHPAARAASGSAAHAPATAKVPPDAGPPGVKADAIDESASAAEKVTKAAARVVARATVETAKYLSRVSADTATKTAVQLASGSKKNHSNTTQPKRTTITRTTLAEAPTAVGSWSTSDGRSGGTGNARFVEEPVSTTDFSRSASPSARSLSSPPPQVRVGGAPAWVLQSLGKQGAVYRTKIVVGPYKTRQECDQALPGELLLAARTVIDRQMGDSHRISDNRLLPYLSQRVVREEWEEHKESETAAVGEMTYLHALLEFDDRSWRELARMQHEREIQQRLQEVGVEAGLLFVLLGTVFGYLKLDTMTRGYYTGRLQLAAGAVILCLIWVLWRLAPASVQF